mmetsp:Transcript_4263/g.12444  ORF Transcript_4263/g.12444 Transcript_4263/m.12444 type:complete len:318 (+) Transcript_4263:1680-2633(+)
MNARARKLTCKLHETSCSARRRRSRRTRTSAQPWKVRAQLWPRQTSAQPRRRRASRRWRRTLWPRSRASARGCVRRRQVHSQSETGLCRTQRGLPHKSEALLRRRELKPLKRKQSWLLLRPRVNAWRRRSRLRSQLRKKRRQWPPALHRRPTSARRPRPRLRGRQGTRPESARKRRRSAHGQLTKLARRQLPLRRSSKPPSRHSRRRHKLSNALPPLLPRRLGELSGRPLGVAIAWKQNSRPPGGQLRRDLTGSNGSRRSSLRCVLLPRAGHQTRMCGQRAKRRRRPSRHSLHGKSTGVSPLSSGWRSSTRRRSCRS